MTDTPASAAPAGEASAALVFSPEEIQFMSDNLDDYTLEEVVEIDKLVSELARQDYVAAVYDDLIKFCQHMMPEFITGTHHRQLADLLMAMAAGEKVRISVSIAPRHGKSQIVSIFFIAWYLGHFPSHKIMLVSHTTDLAVDFGRKVRNTIADPRYQEVFPTTMLAVDSKSAGRWNTTAGGEFFACGIGSAIAGRGAHLLVCDDVHSEQDVLNGNFEVFQRAYEWFTYGARTRLMPGARIAIVGTRWHQDDLIGRVIKDMAANPLADQYEVFEFPALLEVPDPDTGGTRQKALWPEFFDLEALLKTKASMPVFQWNAQYQQNPTGEEGAIIKRGWWNIWMEDDPPDCEYVIMAMDTAAESHNKADFTSIATWGVWWNDKTDMHNIILLDAIKERYEFPDLKKRALEVYNEVTPDTCIVEKKSSGAALYQEMRRGGLPVIGYTPHRGSGDKIARLNSVSDIVKEGLCWIPATRWGERVMEEVAAFPFGSNDDEVDTTVMALTRFRQGGFIRLASDPQDEIQYFKRKRKGYY
jgi:predicted phage terminase large subunit-like protein